MHDGGGYNCFTFLLCFRSILTFFWCENRGSAWFRYSSFRFVIVMSYFQNKHGILVVHSVMTQRYANIWIIHPRSYSLIDISTLYFFQIPCDTFGLFMIHGHKVLILHTISRFMVITAEHHSPCSRWISFRWLSLWARLWTNDLPEMLQTRIVSLKKRSLINNISTNTMIGPTSHS